MAKLPQPISQAKKILDVFAHHQSRAGDGLPVRVLLSHYRTSGMQPSDIAEAIQAAKDAGYVEDGPSGGVLLTAAGRSAY